MTRGARLAMLRPVVGAPTAWRLALAAVLVASSIVGPAAAQDARDGDARDEAREAFQRGSEAAQEERWADSEREFRRAYELSGATSALFNRAVALRALGRHVEARDAFDVLLTDASALDPAVREQVETLRRESAARVARLVLGGLAPPGSAQRVLLDGDDAADEGARPLDLEVDEGHHTLSVEQAGFEPFRWSGDASAGRAVTIDVALIARPEAAPSVVVVEPEPGVDVVEEPWFWIVIGVVVLGAAAGITTGLMLDAQLQPASPLVFEL